MTSAVRVAVVGAGGWGRQHARIFATRPDTELCAVVGRNPERTARRAAEYGTRAYTDVAEMLADARPDLVSVCLPNEDHFDTTLQLIRAGIPLLVEKPLVFDLDQADRLMAEAAARSVFVAVNFNHRYAEPVLRARALIDGGELGDLVFATWRFGGEAGAGTSPHGNLIETQCHGFDLLEHLVAPITSVSAQMTDLTGHGYRTVALSLAFANRAVGTMIGSYDSSYAYPGSQLVEINGTRGRAVVRDTVQELSWSFVGDPVERRWRPGYFDDEARTFTATFDRHVEAVLTALREGAPPPVPMAAGRRALQLALAAIESEETGRRVPTPVPRDRP